MAVRKKQDDSNLKVLRELVTNSGNRQCFDCGQKGPTYANITIGSFVCTRCSGVLRGLTPPHRVKSISMATFSLEEIEFLKSHGNDDCAKTWLGLWDPKRIVHQEQRELMIDKYERKRYYLEPASPLKSLTNAATSKLSSSSSVSSSVSSLSAACSSINNHNSSNNNMCNFYNYLSENTNNSNHSKTSSCNSTLSNSLNNGHHQNGILAPPSPKHHNVPTSSYCSTVQQNTLNGNNTYNRPHSSTYFQQQHQQPTNSYSKNLKFNKTGSTMSSGFTPDSDFVADFSSANIFNATAGSVNRMRVHQNDNSVINNTFSTINGITATSENFADFDHAPIFNAAGIPVGTNNSKHFAPGPTNASLKLDSAVNSTPSADRYAALKDLDEQLREIKTTPAVPNSTVFSNPDIIQKSTSINGNPFKTIESSSGNPFQANGNNCHYTNGINEQFFDNASHQFKNQQQSQNLSNSFGNNTNFGIFNNYPNNNNGNGFNNYDGSTGMHQSTLIPSYSSIKNPFLTTSPNSNNPFL